MNKWQKKYCDTYYGGKKPKSSVGKMEYEMLGLVKKFIVVTHSDGKVDTFKVELEGCNMPKGIIDVCALASNLRFWNSRNLEIKTY